MSANLDPEKIFEKFSVGKQGFDETFKLLESIINETDLEELRTKAVECIGFLPNVDNKILKVLEKSLISDESAVVRSAAALGLVNTFSDDMKNPVKWAIQNENSVAFFKTLLEYLKMSRIKVYKELETLILDKIGRIYQLYPSDSRFILDIEYLDYLKFKSEFSSFLRKFEITNEEKLEILMENTVVGGKGLGRIDLVKDERIVKLTLSDFDEIPESICALEKLERLRIINCSINSLPKCLHLLKSFKTLVLSQEDSERLFESLKKFTHLEIRIQK